MLAFAELDYRLTQEVGPAAKTLERCIAERSAKDKTFAAAVAVKLQATLNKIKSLTSDILKKN